MIMKYNIKNKKYNNIKTLAVFSLTNDLSINLIQNFMHK